MTTIDKLLDRYFEQRTGSLQSIPDRALATELIKQFLATQCWLERQSEFKILEAALDGLSSDHMKDVKALQLVQIVRSHVLLLRVKLDRCENVNYHLRR